MTSTMSPGGRPSAMPNARRPGRWTSQRWVRAMLGVLALLTFGGTGCSLDSLLNRDELPSDVTDPATTQTPGGALAAYSGTLAKFRVTFGGNPSFVVQTGLLSDELLYYLPGGRLVDQRSVPTQNNDGLYNDLHQIRGQASQTIQLLTRYLPDQPALAGHLYALKGYAELFLAELYCSGIPLSTLDYDGDYTYRPGSSTSDVLTHAIALFDTALTLAGDSTQFLQLAQVGQARAWLGLGEYAAAATAAAAVSDAYRYDVHYAAVTGSDTTKGAPRNFAYIADGQWNLTVPDREGFNGLDWRTSGDPRAKSTAAGTFSLDDGLGHHYGGTVYHPDRYASDGASSIILASGVEARLIEAEAALQANNPAWLTTLNTLRTDGVSDPPDTLIDTLGVTGCSPTSICGTTPASNVITKGQPAGYPPVGYAVAGADTTFPAPAGIQAYCQSASRYKPCAQGDSMVVYTYVKPRFWHAGTGGVMGLAPLTDPGTAASRVDLVFRERAFWLFLTGHRQGDLRRLIRQYGRDQSEVYPVGLYRDGAVSYGTTVVLPVPAAEGQSNPLYTGCASYGA